MTDLILSHQLYGTLKKELQLCFLVMVSPVTVEGVASCQLTFLGFILAFGKAEPVFLGFGGQEFLFWCFYP